jgi:hypothetical protein
LRHNWIGKENDSRKLVLSNDEITKYIEMLVRLFKDILNEHLTIAEEQAVDNLVQKYPNRPSLTTVEYKKCIRCNETYDNTHLRKCSKIIHTVEAGESTVCGGTRAQIITC